MQTGFCALRSAIRTSFLLALCKLKYLQMQIFEKEIENSAFALKFRISSENLKFKNLKRES
jgi:hypothetical protein